MNHAKTSFSTDIFAGAIISVVQCLAPLRYVIWKKRKKKKEKNIIVVSILLL
jgi:tellurite resistance protein TehA-like permease